MHFRDDCLTDFSCHLKYIPITHMISAAVDDEHYELMTLKYLEFEHLLLAHGHPWIGGAREALTRFLEEGAG